MTTWAYLASCETEHFSFSALGYDEKHARKALIAAFDAHREQYSRPGNRMLKGWWKAYDITVVRMDFGIGQRDREPLGNHVTWRM